MSRTGCGYWPPALLTSPSMRPWAASTSATICLTPGSSRMSQEWIVTRAAGAAAAISAFTASSFSSLRPTSASAAPRLASSCAMQRPMPLPPPVTMTVWPANRPAR
jgi:hypothetical protein